VGSLTPERDARPSQRLMREDAARLAYGASCAVCQCLGRRGIQLVPLLISPRSRSSVRHL